jgi:hypothetical protein
MFFKFKDETLISQDLTDVTFSDDRNFLDLLHEYKKDNKTIIINEVIEKTFADVESVELIFD